MKLSFLCRTIAEPDEDGGYSIYALDLPGCASQGDTYGEAYKNIAEALKGCLESYIEDNEKIPWEINYITNQTNKLPQTVINNPIFDMVFVEIDTNREHDSIREQIEKLDKQYLDILNEEKRQESS